jgi:hypothetical protein
MKTKERELNTWYDDLLWCPSQCYYYFMHGNDMFCIYLRWRHQNPWTVEIIRCEEGDMSLSLDTSTWKWVSAHLRMVPQEVESRLQRRHCQRRGVA